MSLDIADGIHVYRYSPSKLLDVVRDKVSKLSDPKVFSTFTTLQRILARAGLSDETSNVEPDKRAELASCEFIYSHSPRCQVIYLNFVLRVPQWLE